MAMKTLQRLWDSFGFNERFDETGYEYAYDGEEDSPEDYAPEDLNRKPLPLNNIVGMPGLAPGQVEIIVIEPRSFEEAPLAVVALRERKLVILNVGLLDLDAAQRAVDFVAGGVFAIDGQQERLGESIFLFTPSFVQVSNYAEKANVVVQPTAPFRSASPAATWVNAPVNGQTRMS